MDQLPLAEKISDAENSLLLQKLTENYVNSTVKHIKSQATENVRNVESPCLNIGKDAFSTGNDDKSLKDSGYSTTSGLYSPDFLEIFNYLNTFSIDSPSIPSPPPTFLSSPILSQRSKKRPMNRSLDWATSTPVKHLGTNAHIYHPIFTDQDPSPVKKFPTFPIFGFMENQSQFTSPIRTKSELNLPLSTPGLPPAQQTQPQDTSTDDSYPPPSKKSKKLDTGQSDNTFVHRLATKPQERHGTFLRPVNAVGTSSASDQAVTAD